MIRNSYKIATGYLVFALLSGLFYHEAAYYTEFTGVSVLRLVHSHAFGLGTLVFLLLPLFMNAFHIEEQKNFKAFLVTYNLGLIMSIGFMSVRGVIQLFELPISGFSDHMIGGLAGIGHVILTVGIIFLFRVLFLSADKKKGGK